MNTTLLLQRTANNMHRRNKPNRCKQLREMAKDRSRTESMTALALKAALQFVDDPSLADEIEKYIKDFERGQHSHQAA